MLNEGCRVFSVYNIKGGVGKTATAVNLAYVAAKQGAKVLLWDLDPQGAATFYFRIKPKIKGSGKGIVSGRDEADGFIKGSDFDGLEVLPSDFSYRNLDLALKEEKSPEKRLAKVLRPLKEEYDYIFLDCPPSISMLSRNIFYASDYLLCPIVPTTLSLRTYAQLRMYFKKHEIPRKKILPFFSMMDRRKKLHKEVVKTLFSKDPSFLETVILSLTNIEKMGISRAPVEAFAPGSLAARSYLELWREVRERTALGF